LKIQQVILSIAALGLVVLLFVFGKTVQHKSDSGSNAPMMGIMQQQSAAMPAIELNDLMNKANGTLPKVMQDSVAQLNEDLTASKNEKEKISLLKKLTGIWDRNGNIMASGVCFEQLAGISNLESDLKEAAVRFSLSYNDVTDSLVRGFAVNHAINDYQQLLNMDSTNQDYKIGLALAYMDGAGNVMNGVSLLKEVELVNPDNIQMNLTLARFGIMSGQFDKAITRLNKVISLSNDNQVKAEAWYQLGEAYRATGKKDEAIKALENSKALMTNPDFKKQLDIYIQQIKNS